MFNNRLNNLEVFVQGVISVVGLLYVSKVLTLLKVMAKEKFDYNFSSCCNLHLKFGKITSGFNLTNQWKAGSEILSVFSLIDVCSLVNRPLIISTSLITFVRIFLNF